MFLCPCRALVYIFVPSSLAYHVFFMLCSIFLKLFFSFVWASFSHSSCTPSHIITLVLFPSFLLIHFFIRDKKGESILKCFIISIWLSCTFVGGESHMGDAYTKGEKTSFMRKPCFALFYFMLVFSLLYDALSYI